MKSRARNLDVIHHGMVLISDGRGRGKPARLELTRDALSVQTPIGLDDSLSSQNTEHDMGFRHVTIRRQKDQGLGLAIKGGKDASGDMPVMISKILKHLATQLFVGDTIVEVNGMSADGKTHDDVVNMLKAAGDEIQLTVRYNSQMAPLLRRGSSLQKDRSSSIVDRLSDTTGTWKSSLKAYSDTAYGGGGPDRHGSVSGASSTADEAPEGWKLHVKIPLPMAYITRYLWGTDKLRSNAFEVRAVDGTTTGIVHCEDGKALDQWIRHINNNILHLNNKSIKMSNKYLHPSEQIIYLGWISEMESEGVEGDLKMRWEPRFVIIKGSDVCLFETPPLSADDLQRCVNTYRIYETNFKVAKSSSELKDRREWCFWLETAYQTKHYLSMESKAAVDAMEAAWCRAVHLAVTKMQSKTFAVNYQGLPCGLILDLHQGFQLYNIATKRYLWQFNFSELKNSADDGKMRLRIVFNSETGQNGEEIKDLDCAELYPLVYCMHCFYLTRIIGIDPDYLKNA